MSIAEDIIRDVAELEPADSCDLDTLKVSVSDLQVILDRYLASPEGELAAALAMAPPAAGLFVLGALKSFPVDGMPADAPATAAVAVNHQGVVVDRGYPWQPMASCPTAAKVQLLGGGGIAYYGTWNGKDTWPRRWAPVPKLVDGPL